MRGLFARQVYRPVGFFAGIDFKIAYFVVAAFLALVETPDRENLVTHAHQGFAAPTAAFVIINGIDVVILSNQRIFQKRL